MFQADAPIEDAPQRTHPARRQSGGREDDPDVAAAHEAIRAFKDSPHKPAVKRAAWLYWIRAKRAPNRISPGHLDVAHDLDRYVCSVSGHCYPSFDALLLHTGWSPKTLENRLGDLRRWGLLVMTDRTRPRPASLCGRAASIGAVFVLTVPGGDWDAVVAFYQGKGG